VNHASDHAH